MQNKRWEILKQYWNLNDLGSALILPFKDFSSILNQSSKDELLSREEQYIYSKFEFKKRQQEWLHGRVCAKLLIKKYLQEKILLDLPFSKIQIDYTKSGKPFTNLSGLIKNIDLSISHSGDLAFAAILNKSSYRIGVDIETFKLIDKSAYKFFLSETEINLLKRKKSQPNIIEYWTLKEAILKALSIGLKGDLMGIKINTDNNTALISQKNIKLANLKSAVVCYVKQQVIDNYSASVTILKVS